MNQFSKLIQLIQRQCSWTAGSRRSNVTRYERRRLFLEPLQPREVLAVAVDAFTPTPSGFVAELSAEIRQSVLNLYDTQSHAMGATDVTLTGNVTGNVPGSLVVQGTTLTFIATGGALPTDTYTVTMRSAADGIVDQALGEALDGEFSGAFPSGNGVAGGDFNFSFSVTANPLVVSIPDFARGPTQSVQVPALGSGVALPAGLPIQLSDTNGVTSFILTVTYDPALLSITAAELGADAPSGSQVETNLTIPGQATIAFFSLEPMTGGAADLVNLIAEVPETATYGATQVIDITFLEVNAGELQATADDALHVVAFPGDANANRRYDAEDARLIARTGIGLDSGFVTSTPTTTATTNLLYPNVDAVIIGDVTGVDGLSPLDASDVLRRVVGLSTPNIPALPAAQSPMGLHLSATVVAENQPSGTSVGTFITTDPDVGDTFTYSLVAGAGDTNNSLFTISGATLRTAAVFNHATQPTLNVRVRTTDSTGRSLDNTFTIAVTDINEAPTSVAISNDTVAENIAIGTSVGTLTSTDPDSNNTFAYALVSGTGDTDNAAFTIVGDELRVAATLDFETSPSYSVRIRSTDQGGLSVDQILTIAVTNVNEAPTSVSLSNSSVLEAQPIGALVGTLATTDPDSGDTHVYSLVAGDGGADNASFAVNGGELLTAEVFDHATKDAYTIRVQSTDAGGLSVEQVLTITVAEQNLAPTSLALSNSSVDENAAVGTVVGTFSTTDPNASDTHTYTLVAGPGDTDNNAFTTDGDQLLAAESFDFEMQNTYSIRVQSTDPSGLNVEAVLTITVNDLNEAPTELSLSNATVAEDVVLGTAVGTLSTTDPDVGDTYTYSLVAGDGDADNASFTIVGDELQTAATLDFETQQTYSIRVQSMDQGGLAVEQMLTITVTDVNEAPTAIVASRTTVAENEPIGTLVGNLTTVDPDANDAHTYSFASGNGDVDNASFAIDGNQLLTSAIFDQATQDTYSIRVQSLDSGGLTLEQVLTITIAETNVAPTAVSLSNSNIDENSELDTIVGTLSTTDANLADMHTYQLVGGDGDTDNGIFTINDDQLYTAAPIDFETQGSYSVRVRSTDSYGLSLEDMFNITVNDLNEAPVALALSNDTVIETAPIGTVVGMFSTTDPDSGDSSTYSLVAGDGDTDNASFTIDGDQLKTLVTCDCGINLTYSIRVQSMDQEGLTVEQTFIITVIQPNVAPTAVALSNSSAEENAGMGADIGTLTTTDANASDTHTYALVVGEGDTDNALFTIAVDQLLADASFDFETRDTYSIRVRSTDPFGLAVDEMLTVTINDVNDGPTGIAISSTAVAEAEPVGTLVGTFSTTDQDVSDTHSYAFVTGEGDTDNASFTLNGDQLLTNEVFDHATKDTYVIRVQSTDAGGLTVEETLTITIIDPNMAPTAIE
jgi:uncharacterized protein YggE